MKRKVFVCTLYPCLWQYWCYAVTSRIKHRTCLASGTKLNENIDFFACCNCCFTENFFSNAKSILYYIEVRDWSLKSALLINFLCIDSVSSEKLQQYFHKPRFQAFFQHFIKRGHLNWKYVTNSFVMLYWMCFVTYHYLFGTWHICWYYEFPVSMCQCTDPTVVRYWQSGKVATITMTMFTWQCLVGPGTLPPVSSLPFN